MNRYKLALGEACKLLLEHRFGGAIFVRFFGGDPVTKADGVVHAISVFVLGVFNRDVSYTAITTRLIVIRHMVTRHIVTGHKAMQLAFSARLIHGTICK